ncbi:Thaumatin [Savitreella phatthalungensis]
MLFSTVLSLASLAAAAPAVVTITTTIQGGAAATQTSTVANTAATSAATNGLAYAAGNGYYALKIVNNCKQTIWPGLGQVSTSPAKLSDADSGFELAQGASKVLHVPTNWVAGRVFARTGCTGSGSSFSCTSGSCSSGLACSSTSGVPNLSLAEFSYSDMDMIFYNLSLDSGYNLPIQITPTDAKCLTYTCGSKDCSDEQAYQPWSSKNPCMGCSKSSSYTVTFCPA